MHEEKDTALEKLIEKIKSKRDGDFLWPQDIVELGIASTPATLTQMKKRGAGPKFLQLASKMCRYAKEDVIEWVRKSRNQV